MKHLKLFNQENEYLDALEQLDCPNVSYVIETDAVYYHPFIETMIVATYNVTSSGEEVKLLNRDYTGGGIYGDPVYTFDINKIEEMHVDGVKLSEPVRSYTFNEPGEHVVKYKFYDIENALVFNTIDGSAFYGCTKLTGIIIPDGVTSIGDQAFSDCTSLTSVTIGNGVTSIGGAAFADCSSLTSITIPDSVTSIGSGAFYACYLLTSINIPDSVTSIGVAAFMDCTSLKSVTIPDSVTLIGDSAFHNCDALTSITIPDGVTSIGEAAFSYCSKLASVYCKPTTPPALDVAFYNNALGRKIYVPMKSVDVYKAATGWIDYASDIEGYNF